jgi:branched-chain amino acid transport system permease protein
VFLATALQQLINGLDLGSIYALIALGYTMVYGIVKLINFAHGEVMMVGAYIGFFVMTGLDANPDVSGVQLTLESGILGIITAMVGSALLGMTIEFLAYKPLRKRPRINALITAIGVSLLLQNLGQVLPFVGPNFKVYPQPNIDLSPANPDISSLSIFGVNISFIQILVFGITFVSMIALWIFVSYTKTGKAMRAAAYDQTAAALMGISVNRIISITFAIGSALAGLAGVLYSMKYNNITTPTMGLMPGLKAFVAAVVGGIGNIPGAVLGGLLIGVFETLVNGYISSQWSEVIVFGLLIVVLMIRPSGLLGKERGEKV